MDKKSFIKALREDGCTYQKIGEIFGVTYQAIIDNPNHRFPRTKSYKYKKPAFPPKEIRFIKKVLFSNKDDCWLWTGSKYPLGYGRVDNRQYAHRYSYQFYYGSIPDECPVIMHSCDNPACVNPHHLIAGTMADNMHDRDMKGRGYRKKCLSPEQVIEIRKLYSSGLLKYSGLTKLYGVSPSVIAKVIKKKYSYSD